MIKKTPQPYIKFYSCSILISCCDKRIRSLQRTLPSLRKLNSSGSLEMLSRSSHLSLENSCIQSRATVQVTLTPSLMVLGLAPVPGGERTDQHIRLFKVKIPEWLEFRLNIMFRHALFFGVWGSVCVTL